jgi:UDP-3-O-[3-hydroxymyristoyl] glucosamine N-acyltransferase
MGDTRTNTPVSKSVGELASRIGGRVVGRADLPIHGLNTLDRAVSGEMTFVRDGAYARDWAQSKASAALVSDGLDIPGHDEHTRALVFVPNADLALNTMLEVFAKPIAVVALGVHPSAVVHATARIGTGATIGPFCVIGEHATIGDGCTLVASIYIGANARVGPGSTLYPGVHVGDHCEVGRACILHAGVSIGADGFGYRPDPSGRGLVKIPHIGNVVIGDAVEIGANACIDRAKFGSTIIGDGTKIDNLVQIAHNCRIGRCCIICGNSGLAGSVTLEDGVILSGGVGVADNRTIGAGARVGAYAGVLTEDIPAGESWIGMPAAPGRDMIRNWITIRTLSETLRGIKKAIASLESRVAARG